MTYKKRPNHKRGARWRSPGTEIETGSLHWKIALWVGLVAFFAFVQTLGYDFVHDDEQQILRNPWIRDWSNLKSVFTSDVWRFANPSAVSNYYRPMHMLMHMFGNTLSGLQPVGYHLINVVLHAVCAGMVAVFALRLTGDKWVSVCGGMIFALYPAHAESVAWVAGITDPLCALFYFGALCLYLSDRRSPSLGRLFAICALFLGALLSKEMALTFPFVAAWLDFSLDRKGRWSRYAALTAVFLVYVLLRVTALGRLHVRQNQLSIDGLSLALSTIVLAAQYLAKEFVPYGINAFHVFVPTTDVVSPECVASLILLSAWGALAFIFRKQGSALFLIGFCCLSLVPVLNMSGIGESIFADRYLYIPTLGSSLLVPVVAVWAWKKTGWKRGRSVAVATAMLLFVGYAWVLAHTTFMWKDSFTLFSETIRRSPRATLMANNLGVQYFYKGEYENAKAWFSRALVLAREQFIHTPRHFYDSYSGLGGVALHRGDAELARTFFLKAHEIDPTEVGALENLGVTAATSGDFAKALEYYERALAMNPLSEAIHNNLAAMHVKLRMFDEAIAEARKALEIHPGFAEAHLTMARAYAGKGLIKESRSAYLQAQELDPSKSRVVRAELLAVEGFKD